MATFDNVSGWLEAAGVSKKAIAFVALASLLMVVIAREVYGIDDSSNLFIGFVFVFGVGAAIVAAVAAMRKKRTSIAP